MKRFIVEIDTRDPAAGRITPGLIGDAVREVLDAEDVAYGRVAVDTADDRVKPISDDIAKAVAGDERDLGPDLGGSPNR
jgi:hypothetical protein